MVRQRTNTDVLCPRPAAFSLVEVMLAVGIATFCLVALMGLFSVGLGLGKNAKEELLAASLIQSLLATRAAAPASDLGADFPLPVLQKGNALLSGENLIDADGRVSTTGARYRLSYRVEQTAVGDFRPFRMWLRLSWPAAAPSANAAGRIEVASSLLPES